VFNSGQTCIHNGKKVGGSECPWLTSGIKSAMVERDYYLRKAYGTAKEVYRSL